MTKLKTIIFVILHSVLSAQSPSILILGITQDGGYPHAGCYRECCDSFYKGKEKKKKVSCLGIIDPMTKSTWMIDATPDFPIQSHLLLKKSGFPLKGILLTHAHIGHYTGLMHLGREVMGAQKMPVFAMPKMKSFIENNGPWSQLVSLENINLIELKNESHIPLSSEISILPMQVPHRDEFSETVGFIIQSKSKKVLYIPDIDKWAKWQSSIVDILKEVDIALIDGTFHKNGEIIGRDMSAIPHPFIQESVSLFEKIPHQEKSKIKFIHLNHTNPVLRKTRERKELLKLGYGVAKEGEIVRL